MLRRDARRGGRMAGHVRRLADMHPAAVVVPADLSKSIVHREKKDRRADGRDPLPKPRASTGTAALRDSHLDPAGESLWR